VLLRLRAEDHADNAAPDGRDAAQGPTVRGRHVERLSLDPQLGEVACLLAG